MFSIASLPVRTYEFEHPDTRAVLHIAPPKLEVLEIFAQVFADPDVTPAAMCGIGSVIVSNNTEGVTITKEEMLRWFDSFTLAAFVEDFLGWINGVKASDPN